MLQNVILMKEPSCLFITCNIQLLKPEPVLKGRSEELYSLVSDERELTFISSHTLVLRLSVTQRPSVHCSISAHLKVCVCVCIYKRLCISLVVSNDKLQHAASERNQRLINNLGEF